MKAVWKRMSEQQRIKLNLLMLSVGVSFICLTPFAGSLKSKGTSRWEPVVTDLGVDPTPSPPSSHLFFFFPPFLLRCLLTEAHPYSQGEKKKKNLHAADSRRTISLHVYLKVIQRRANKMKSTDHNFFSVWSQRCLALYNYQCYDENLRLFNASWVCGMLTGCK